MTSRSLRLIAFFAASLAALFAFVSVPSNVSANQARFANNFGSVIGTVNVGAEKYFTINMRDGSTPRDALIVAQ